MPKFPSDHVSAAVVMRRFLLVFLFVGLILACIIGAIYRQDALHQREVLEQEAEHVLDLQQELLSFELRAVQSDILYLASQDVLQDFVSGENPSEEASARDRLEHDYVSFALNKRIYEQVRYLDASGQETIRINYQDGDTEVVPESELQSKATRYYYRQALSLDKGEVFVSPFDLNVEHGQIEQPIEPVIRFLTPVFDQSGDKRGLLVLNYLGAQLLSNLKQISAVFRGETMLVNSAGEYLQAPDATHEWGWLLGHPHSFRNEFPAAWKQGNHLESGQLRVGQDLFGFRHVSPGSRAPVSQLQAANVVDDHESSSLILISYVSTAAASARSRELLKQLLLMFLGVMAVVALPSYYWARSRELRKYHEQHIAESESRLRQLSSQLLAAQETERRNLSRDLHDELGQQVTAISLDLRSLERKLGDSHPNPLLQHAIEETDQLLKSLHEIATRVRPSVLDDLGLQDAVESLLSEYQQRTGVDVTSRLHLQEAKIPPKVGENAYRILQEALANVVTHAQTDRVEVTIEAGDQMLHMAVEDHGVGFNVEALKESKRLGILGMRERVELLHGRFDLASTPGRGTQIRISIPLGSEDVASLGEMEK